MILKDEIKNLSLRFQRITISEDDIRKVLNRPMTHDAVKAFRKYINSLTVGSNGGERQNHPEINQSNQIL